MILNGYVHLGDNDYPCETCGPSYDSIEYAFNTELQIHQVNISTGCYGGETFESKIPGEVINVLVPYRKSHPESVEDINELIRWLSR